MSPLLSVLIPTINMRHEEFDRLYTKLRYDIRNNQDEIEILSLCDNKELTIGAKRNWLYANANGEYSLQVDDDDLLSDDWVERVLGALAEKPDCVTYQEYCMIDGTFFSSNHSLKYPDWWEKMDGFDYVRTPYMKDVIRTDIARSVLVPDIRFGEDHQWSRLIKPHLKSEVHLNEYIYYYLHKSSPHIERYGITE